MTPRSDHHASGKGKHATGARAGGRGNAGQTKRDKTSGKFKRARIRHFLFTVGPDRLMRGRIRRRRA